MAPPTTRLGQIQHHGTVLQYRAHQWLQSNADLLGSFLRLVIFGLKLASLSWICWPYTFKTGILTTLFGLAALDLWRPMVGGATPNHLIGPREGRSVARAGTGSPDIHGGPTVIPRRWQAGWWQSSALLGLHFLIIWVTSRYGSLCAAGSPEKFPVW